MNRCCEVRQPDWAVLCSVPSSVRSRSGQPCSPFEAGGGGRLARPSTRSPYTYTASGSSPVQSASPKRVPLGKAPTVTARGTLGSWANGACVRLSLRGKARLLPRAASTVRSAILRRRNTASLSRLRPVAHHANRSLAVPLRLLLAHAPLARPSAMARFSS